MEERAVSIHGGDTLSMHIIAVAGLEVWRKIKTQLGGREFKFPKRLSTLHDNHALVKAVGIETARLLSHHFGGEQVYIPRTGTRDDFYYEAYQAGKSNSEIAAELRVSERWVRKVMNERLGIKNENNSFKCTYYYELPAQEIERREDIMNRYFDGELTSKQARAELGDAASAFYQMREKLNLHGSILSPRQAKAHGKANTVSAHTSQN